MKAEDQECFTCLKRSPILCDLNENDAMELSGTKNCHVFRKGQIIFNEGFFPNQLYCVNRGKIKIFKLGDDGREQIVRLAKEGDLIGYSAILMGETYSYSAQAIEDSSVCILNRKPFLEILESNAPLSVKLMRTMLCELKDAENKMSEMAMKPVRERVAKVLLYLREIFGLEEDQRTINASLSRVEIANIVGTGREPVIRLLTEFKNDKVINLVGKKIQILNLPSLNRVANI